MGRFFPVNQINDMTRQNMQLFQQAASMFSPLPTATPSQREHDEKTDNERDAVYAAQQREITALRGEVERLRARLGEAEDTGADAAHADVADTDVAEDAAADVEVPARKKASGGER